jgi:hypothetical protein
LTANCASCASHDSELDFAAVIASFTDEIAGNAAFDADPPNAAPRAAPDWEPNR